MCGFLVYVFVSVFIAGLMVGRTPEYLGKKVDGYDVKLAALYLLAPVFACLAFTGLAAVCDWGLAGLNNSGPHGFSEILYAYTSASANNGSAFAGLTCTPATGDRHYNVTMALAILVGRYFQLVPIVALAGALARKRPAPASVGSFPVTGPTFAWLVASVIIIVGALNFLPSLALGPIVEHYVMNGALTTF
jgi:K+-transporting ATPase ATPase A chain